MPHIEESVTLPAPPERVWDSIGGFASVGNWHPMLDHVDISGEGPGAISADYYGIFADRVQQQLKADRQDPPFVGMMSNGTSGNINIPFNIAVVPSKQGLRVGLLAGFNSQ